LIFLSFQISGCSSEDPTYPIQQAIAKLEKDNTPISEEEWVKYDHEIEEMRQRLKNKRHEFTTQEVEKVNKLIGKYYALKAAKKIGNPKQELKDTSQQLDGAYETILNTKNEIKN
jgi:hypothetical protein